MQINKYEMQSIVSTLILAMATFPLKISLQFMQLCTGSLSLCLLIRLFLLLQEMLNSLSELIVQGIHHCSDKKEREETAIRDE